MLLQFGDKGDNVKYLQYGLHILCCSPNGFDGKFGDGTLTSVKKFQSKYGLVSDGIVGDYTWNRLKDEITSIQYQLNNKGFNVGTADGIAGTATYNGVISFQNKNGLTADGQVGPATWDILFDTISGGNSYSRILKVTSPLMYGEDIRAVQNKLNSLGYVAGTADGYYGNMTKDAIIKFQTNRGLDNDGKVGPNTWNTLFNTSTSGKNGYNRILKLTSPLMYGEDIKAVQNKLNSLGFNCGTADGYYGNDTKNAVIKFQNKFAITADGIVGPTTWMYLFETNGSIEDILKVAGNIGLFENSTLTFMDLKNPTQEIRVSLYPAIYLKGELGINQSLSGSTSNGIINLALSPNTISSNIIKDLSTVNITHNIDKDTLAESIEKLTAIKKIGNTMTYSISVTNLGEIEIKLEAYLPANTELSYKGTTIKLGSKIYQRLIIKIKPDYLPTPSGNGLKTQITVPLYKKNPETNDNVENNIIMTSIMIATAVTLVASLPIAYGIIKAGPVIGTAATFIINLITQFYSKVFS